MRRGHRCGALNVVVKTYWFYIFEATITSSNENVENRKRSNHTVNRFEIELTTGLKKRQL